jgi:hypothetical protein
MSFRAAPANENLDTILPPSDPSLAELLSARVPFVIDQLALDVVKLGKATFRNELRVRVDPHAGRRI